MLIAWAIIKDKQSEVIEHEHVHGYVQQGVVYDYGKLSTLLIFHEITEVSLFGIIISSITNYY